MPSNGDYSKDRSQRFFNGKWRSPNAFHVARHRARIKDLNAENTSEKKNKKNKKKKKRTITTSSSKMVSSEEISKVREKRSSQKGSGVVKSSATASSIDQYKSRVAFLMNQFGYDFDPDKPSDYKLICKHADTILEKIMEKTTNSNSISFYLSCFKSLLEHRKGCSKAFDKFAKAHIALKNDYIERIGENKLSDKEKDILPWSTIQKRVKKTFNTLSPRDQVITALYTMFPPRRADYYIMQLSLSNPPPADKEFNYLVIDDDELIFVFNNYKTMKRYGTQRFPIRGQLAEILMHYIESQGKDDGDFLITKQSSNEPLTRYSFSKAVSAAMHRAIDSPMSINDLRKSAISHYIEKKGMSYNMRKTLAEKMAHSVGTQNLYHRMDLGDGDEDDMNNF